MSTKKLPFTTKLLSGVHKNGQKKYTTVTVSGIEGNELRVLKLLKTKKRQIGEIASLLTDMGSHEKHEKPRARTTTRQVYQIVRNLREMGVPIVGGSEGIWIAKSVVEVEDFAFHFEDKARADIQSMLRLKNVMLNTIGGQKKTLF